MTGVTFLDPAMVELQEATDWYNQRDPGVGDELFAEVNRAIDQFLFDPAARPVVGRNVYRQSVDRFPFDLLYRIRPDRIEIVAVLTTVANRGTGKGVTKNNIDRGEACSSTAVF